MQKTRNKRHSQFLAFCCYLYELLLLNCLNYTVIYSTSVKERKWLWGCVNTGLVSGNRLQLIAGCEWVGVYSNHLNIHTITVITAVSVHWKTAQSAYRAVLQAGYIPARGLVTSILFLSVPPLSVPFLFLPAWPVTMTFSIAALLILAVTIPLFVAATNAKHKVYQWRWNTMHTCVNVWVPISDLL